jgi:hypothetical protein
VGGSFNPVVSAVDANGATDASNSFSWTVLSATAVASPGNQTTGPSVAVDLAVAASGGTGTYTWTGSGLPAGLSLNSATGHITGTPTNGNLVTSNITVTVTDSAGGTATTSTFTWTVQPLAVAGPGNQTTSKKASVSLTLAATGGTAPYASWSASGLPSWLTLNASTGKITGTAPNASSTTLNITVTVTDAKGATKTSSTFQWKVQ